MESGLGRRGKQGFGNYIYVECSWLCSGVIACMHIIKESLKSDNAIDM